MEPISLNWVEEGETVGPKQYKYGKWVDIKTDCGDNWIKYR
jgi:hypothetical protein